MLETFGSDWPMDLITSEVDRPEGGPQTGGSSLGPATVAEPQLAAAAAGAVPQVSESPARWLAAAERTARGLA